MKTQGDGVGPMEADLKYILESLLFVAEDPVSIDQFKKILPMETGDLRDALDALSREYEARKGGFYLTEVAGGFQLRTRPEYSEWIKQFKQPSPVRLSKAALETLAIIAYKQPIIRSDVEALRGVDSGGILRTLGERKLIRVLGRKEIPGRPLIYATTKHFLEVFDLKDLKDLPSPKEIEELGIDGQVPLPLKILGLKGAGPEPPDDEEFPESEAEAPEPENHDPDENSASGVPAPDPQSEEIDEDPGKNT